MIECLKIGQKAITDCGEIANTFGEYFSSVGKNLAQNMSLPTKPISHYINKIDVNS